MYDVVARLALLRHWCGGAGALILILTAGGCGRPPGTSSDAAAKPAVGTQDPFAPTTAPAHADPALEGAQPATTSPSADAPRKYIAYYFHRTMRCPTCLSIEKQSQEAIELAYGGELSAGTLAWQAVNIEEPGNEHFERDFKLDSQSLVLVEMACPRLGRWKLLPRAWELVEDPPGFAEYVTMAVAEFLGG